MIEGHTRWTRGVAVRRSMLVHELQVGEIRQPTLAVVVTSLAMVRETQDISSHM